MELHALKPYYVTKLSLHPITASLRPSPKAVLTYIKALKQLESQRTTCDHGNGDNHAVVAARIHKQAAAKSDELLAPQVL